MESEKIGLTDLFQIKRSARGCYVTIPKQVIETYELKTGDILKMEIIEVHRKPKEEEAERDE